MIRDATKANERRVECRTALSIFIFDWKAIFPYCGRSRDGDDHYFNRSKKKRCEGGANYAHAHIRDQMV